MATQPDLYVGKESMTFEHEGSPVFIGPTIIIRAGHPIMKGREDLFMPLVVHYDVAPKEEPKEEPKAPAKDEPKEQPKLAPAKSAPARK